VPRCRQQGGGSSLTAQLNCGWSCCPGWLRDCKLLTQVYPWPVLSLPIINHAKLHKQLVAALCAIAVAAPGREQQACWLEQRPLLSCTPPVPAGSIQRSLAEQRMKLRRACNLLHMIHARYRVEGWAAACLHDRSMIAMLLLCCAFPPCCPACCWYCWSCGCCCCGGGGCTCMRLPACFHDLTNVMQVMNRGRQICVGMGARGRGCNGGFLAVLLVTAPSRSWLEKWAAKHPTSHTQH